MSRSVYYRNEYRYIGDKTPRPLVQITVFGPSGPGTIEVLSLVDSGADRILIPASVARQLGIALDGVPDEPLGGLGGSATARFVPTQLEWQGLRWTTQVGFTDAIGFGLLGRDDFFARFEIGFNQSDQVLLVGDVI